MSDYESKYQMTQDIKEAIDKNLPAQLSGVLKERLEEADELQKEVAELSNKNQVQTHTIDELREDARHHGSLLGRENDVKEKEAAVDEQEKKLNVTILEAQLMSERRVVETLTGFVAGLARNTEFKRTFFGDIPVGIEKANGYTAPVVAAVNQTTTETAE